MQIESLQRWIIVQSIVYYELNANIVSDKVFDNNCKQLVRLMETSKGVETQYSYCFKDFDGTTGFDLFHKLNKIHKAKLLKEAKYAIRICRR